MGTRTYKQLWNELRTNFSDMNPLQAQLLINRAWKDVRDSRQWSFLRADGVLYSPGLITTGSFTVTQFSATAQASAAAITALTSIANPLITKRQIRFSSGGPLYGITTYVTGTGVMTLDRIYREGTTVGASYMLYRAIYGLPEDGAGTEVTDFERYNSIYNPAISDYFRGINQPGDLLNKIDPQRNNVGNNPYYLFSARADSNANPLFEMWPHPTASQAYLVSYQRRGTELSLDGDVLPAVIPDQLVLERSMAYGCEWAYKNSSRFPNLKGINWLLMKQQHDLAYSNISNQKPGQLEIAQRNDEELYPQNTIIDDRTYTNFAIGDDDRTGWYSINPG